MTLLRWSVVMVVALFSVAGAPGNVFASTPISATEVLAYTNVERLHAGVPLLSTNAQLSQVALRKMEDLFARQYFAHVAPTGEDVSDLVHDVGYEFIAVGENLALGDFVSSKDVVQAWMESPGHRANILSTKYSEIGIAAGRSYYEGRTTWVVVQTFGLPRASCPALDEDLAEDIAAKGKVLDILQSVATMREALLDDRTVSKKVFNARVESYNLVAEMYNKRSVEYSALTKSYNKSVQEYNECVKKKTS